jgi:hypothetical protein
MKNNGLKIRLHGNFALNHGEISTLCGAIEAFKASIRLSETLSIESLEVLRDHVRERAKLVRGPNRDIKLAYATYIDYLIREAKERERQHNSIYE